MDLPCITVASRGTWTMSCMKLRTSLPAPMVVLTAVRRVLRPAVHPLSSGTTALSWLSLRTSLAMISTARR